MSSGKKLVFTKRFWILLCSLLVIVGIVAAASLIKLNAGESGTLSSANEENELSPEISAPPEETTAPIVTPSPEPEPGPDEKVVYLTFDDGPSSQSTPKILDTLEQYDVRATFFLLGSNVKQYPELVKQEYDKGHKLANHSYSHDYKTIYATVGNLLEEIIACNQEIDNALGFFYGNTLFRFPGGSFGRTQFKEAVTQSGYKFVDWNCLGKDAEGKQPRSAADITQAVKDTARGQNHVTVLLHDTNAKKTTVEALPAIIEYFRAEGYSFRTLPNA